MIDGLKIVIRGHAQLRLRSHPLLKWRSAGMGKDGREKFRAKWGAFNFQGSATHCTIMKGSIHLHHYGGTNWQDFTFLQFSEVVETVCIDLGLHPVNMRLANLEVGVNIIPPLPTAEVLRSIVWHNHTTPTAFREGHGIEIRHWGYRFKIYDKARHYERPGHLLRFEVATKQMRTMKKYKERTMQLFKVRTLSDLLDPAKWDALRGYLLARFDELLILEPGLHPAGLRPAAVELLANAGNPNFWAGLNKQRRCDKRKALNDIYTRHAPHGLKVTLRASIAAKLDELNNGPNPELHTNGDNVAPRTFTPTVKTAMDLPEKDQNRTFAPHAIRGVKVRVQDPEVMGMAEVCRCSVCGRDISHQDPRSRVCSERLYGKDGKRCRNALSNRSLTLRRMDMRSLLLFDQTLFIHPPQPRKHFSPTHP